MISWFYRPKQFGFRMIRLAAQNTPAKAFNLLQDHGVRIPKISPQLNLIKQMNLWDSRLDRFFVQVRIDFIISRNIS